MAVAGVLATALTTHAARSKGLFLDGFDVIDQPGAVNGYGVPIESVTVVEQGPGAVSSMTFIIDDPNLAVTIVDGMEVRFEDFTLGQCDFLGYIDHFDVEAAFGTIGRSISVQCTGIDAALDWALLPADITLGNSFFVGFNVQTLYANSIGSPPLRAFVNSSAVSVFDNPIGSGGNAMVGSLTIPAGTTLREAIRQVAANTANGPYKATVDFRFGLRFYSDLGSVAAVDYSSMVVQDQSAYGDTTPQGEPTAYGLDTAQYRGVFIDGGGAAGTGLLMDGTGKPGPIAYILDTTVTTAAALLAAQQAFLALNTPIMRGSITLLDWPPRLGRRPGSNLQIFSQSLTGVANLQVTIAGITKTFNPSGRENWIISFGGAAPSVTQLMRRYTKDARA